MKQILFIALTLTLIQSACKPDQDLSQQNNNGTYMDPDSPIWTSESMPSGNCISLTGTWDTFMKNQDADYVIYYTSRYLPIHYRGINASDDGEYLYMFDRETKTEVSYNKTTGVFTEMNTEGLYSIARKGNISYFSKNNQILRFDGLGGNLTFVKALPEGYRVVNANSNLDTILAIKTVLDSTLLDINETYKKYNSFRYVVMFNGSGMPIDTLTKIGGLRNSYDQSRNLITLVEKEVSKYHLLYSPQWADTSILLNPSFHIPLFDVINLRQGIDFLSDSVLVYSHDLIGVWTCNIKTKVWQNLIPSCQSRGYVLWFYDKNNQRLVFEKSIHRRIDYGTGLRTWITFVSTDLNGQDEQPFLMPEQQ